MRKCGVLLPIFSLPGKYGIGCFSREAYAFIDYLKEAGQSIWQILPVGPTGYGDSPYQSFSTFAGNPYFICPETLTEEGLLSGAECEEYRFSDSENRVDYGLLYQNRLKLLRKAFERSDFEGTKEYEDFFRENSFWLKDYALFMAVKASYGGLPLSAWEENISMHREEAVREWEEKQSREISFYCFLQFEFLKQWKALKAYAAEKGIEIIGDIPIYVSEDSADFWADRSLFQLDETGHPLKVAGVPPDGFSADGQLWGNPLYDWEQHRKTGFRWWLTRIGKCMELYDVIRIDHFRGFDEYFAVGAGEKTAANGVWEKGPGMELFNAIKEKFGRVPIIAEDLGYVTDTVRKLVRDTGFPNMKVLEFAFDSRDSTGAMEYLPYRYGSNCVVYTGTHDNETLMGWIDSILPEEREAVREYLHTASEDKEEIVERMIRLAHSSVADTCIIPMQDYLALGNEARINRPSTQGMNWVWRLTAAQLTPELGERLRRLAVTYGRL